MLLLIEPLDLLDSLPLDSSPALRRLIQMYSPLKSLQTLAADSDLTLTQVFQLTGHLVYWAKATIIYPLCESNVYVVSPDAVITNHLLEAFSEEFPGLCLLQVCTEKLTSVNVRCKIQFWSSIGLGPQRFLVANVDKPEAKSPESIATANAISKDNYMVIEESFALTIAHVRAVYANRARSSVIGKFERLIYIKFVN